MNTSLKIDFRWYWMVLIYCFFMEIKLFLFFVMYNFLISIRYRDFMFKWSNWHQSAHNTPTSSSESQISCHLSITWWFRRGKNYVCGTKSYIMIIQIDVNLMLRLQEHFLFINVQYILQPVFQVGVYQFIKLMRLLARNQSV